jgi:hypothetical protein
MPDDTVHRNNATRIAAAVLIPFSAILILHAHRYWPFLSDDALISLRYAKRLLAGDGLTWTAGHPVEGYSNLLWILLTALLGVFGLDLIQATRVLGFAGMIVIMFCIAHWQISSNGFRRAWFPITITLLFLSLAAPIAVWTIGGLEQPLYGALIAVSIVLAYSIVERHELDRRRTLYLSFVLGLLCITRPDGPLFTIAALGSFFVIYARRGTGVRREILLVSTFPIGFVVGQLLFRVLYYGELIPNTALVKVAPSWIHWRSGWAYLYGGVEMLAPFSFLSIASLVALLVRSRSRDKAIYLLAMSTCWSAYVVFIGGDVFPAYRHLIPLLVIFGFALAEGIQLTVQRAAAPRLYYPCVAACLLLLVPYGRHQLTDKQSQRAIRERWEWDCQKLAVVLKDAFSRQQPLVAVTAAGCLPYWSDLPALDMLGLNDHYLPRHRPQDFGSGFIGHELGDGQYVLRQNPDIIVFNVGSGPHYRSGEELNREPEFHRRYIPVSVRTPDVEPAPIMYVNKESRKVGIGIARSESSITVPGHLFTGPDILAHLNRSKRLVAAITGERPASVRFESIEPVADWVVHVRTSSPDEITTALQQTGAVVSVSVRSRSAAPVDVEEVQLKRP